MGSGAFVDCGEVLPVVEDVGADLLGCFHGGCTEDNHAVGEGVSASTIKQGNLVGIGVAYARDDNTKAIYFQMLSGEDLFQADQFAFLEVRGMNQWDGFLLFAVGW